MVHNQVAILPVSDKYNEDAQNLLKLLNNYDIRAFVDERSEKVGRKIRDTEIQKVPYMIILGEKEIESQKISVRRQGKGDLGSFGVDEFAKLITEEIKKELN